MKTSELTGDALDWAVAKCEPNMLDLYYSDENEPLILEEAPDYHQVWAPSTNWAQGGPIIEREGIDLKRVSDSCWDAHTDNVNFYESGQTPLIAAMRCYVASKLGDEVDVPEELL